MERYTLQQRIEIVKIHYENGENFAIVKLVQKFELLGQVSDVKNRTRTRRARTPTYIDSDVDDVYLQQNGATCHTSGKTICPLREKFPGRVISETAITIGHQDHAI